MGAHTDTHSCKGFIFVSDQAPPPPLHQTLDLPFVYMYMCGLPSDYVGILGAIV